MEVKRDRNESDAHRAFWWGLNIYKRQKRCITKDSCKKSIRSHKKIVRKANNGVSWNVQIGESGLGGAEATGVPFSV